MPVRTRRVDAGAWRTIEVTYNASYVACFKDPPGAKVKSTWLFTEETQVLDGEKYKKVVIRWGKIQVLVPNSQEIKYTWDPLVGNLADFPAIEF